ALANCQAHVQLARAVQVGNDVLRINDLDVVIRHDVACRYSTGTLCAQCEDSLILTVENTGDALQVEQDLDNIFLYTFNRAVLMYNAVNLDFLNRTTRHGGQQDTTQCITKCMSEAALEGLQYHLGVVLVILFNLDQLWRQKIRQ